MPAVIQGAHVSARLQRLEGRAVIFREPTELE